MPEGPAAVGNSKSREWGWEWLPRGLGMQEQGGRTAAGMEKRDRDQGRAWGPSEGAGVVLRELPQLLLLCLRLVSGDHQGMGIAHGHLERKWEGAAGNSPWNGKGQLGVGITHGMGKGHPGADTAHGEGEGGAEVIRSLPRDPSHCGIPARAGASQGCSREEPPCAVSITPWGTRPGHGLSPWVYLRVVHTHSPAGVMSSAWPQFPVYFREQPLVSSVHHPIDGMNWARPHFPVYFRGGPCTPLSITPCVSRAGQGLSHPKLF